MDNHVYCFIHIPKTGGSTIIVHLRTNLDYDTEFVHLGAGGDNYRRRYGLEAWEKRSNEERNKVRILAGHQMRLGVHELVVGRPARYFTVLRDPADRILSVYNFRLQQEGRDIPFWDWYEEYPRNNGYKWLKRAFRLEGDASPSEIIAKLDNFWFVGVTEQLGVDLPDLFAHFGIIAEWIDQRVSVSDREEVDRQAEIPRMYRWMMGNSVYRKLEMSGDLKEQLYEQNKRDLKLYRYAQKRREETRKRLREV